MRFRPCIDLHNGKVKQIVGSTLSDDSESSPETNFISTKGSDYYADLYRQNKLSGGHVIMLGPGNEEAALLALDTYKNGLQVGGGINPGNAEKFLKAGASHVIVTSYIFHDGVFSERNLKELHDTVGKENLVIDLSCKSRNDKYFVVTNRWQKFTTFEISEENLRFLSAFCDEFLVHAADVEGMKSGIDENLVEHLSECCKIPITYAGGVRSIDDFSKIDELGHGRVDATVGSALDIFGGTLSFDNLVKWNNERNR